jgi:hypothetical protein
MDPAPSILSFAVVAALVTTAGTLVGHLLKEITLARSFEMWKQRRTVDALYHRYRDPLVLSCIELANRLGEILDEHPVEFLTAQILSRPLPEPSGDAVRDEYFLRYKYQSPVYRLAAFLGWIELYRQDLVFLEVAQKRSSQALEEQIRNIRADMADGHLNTAEDWADWRDALIFREEQRALGDTMIVVSGGVRTVMGYGAFVTALEDVSSSAYRWTRVAVSFLADPGRVERDFRLERYRRLLVHLFALAQANEPARVSDRLRERVKKYSASRGVGR